MLFRVGSTKQAARRAGTIRALTLGAVGLAWAALGLVACTHSEPAQHAGPGAAAAPVAPVAAGVAPMSPVRTSVATATFAPAAGGPRVSGAGFTLEAVPPDTASVGSAATARIVIKPSGEFHLNKDFPTSITITPPEGVDLPKGKLAAADAKTFTDTEASFDLPFTAKDAGTKKFTAIVKFAVCTDVTCDPKRETLAWEVAVK